MCGVCAWGVVCMWFACVLAFCSTCAYIAILYYSVPRLSVEIHVLAEG